MENPFFTRFKSVVEIDLIPNNFTMIKLGESPHPLSLLAAQELQHYLQTQTEWAHNFGLNNDLNSAIIGKMFGVLVVQNAQQEVGYLAAFSGKLAGGNHHSKFVPPVFDLLTVSSFLSVGMKELKAKTDALKTLEINQSENSIAIIKFKQKRKQFSNNLQQQIFDNYSFLNQQGNSKNIRDIFDDASYKNPPAGAGECAGPKLLQYAFLHQLKPLALTEFWWGQSPKSVNWKHGHFYPCCKEKCEPILAHMLQGLVNN
ncbi:MAG: pseudouridylate synthase [Bacteroidia bacterium]|nr:pseudouridylate synthase [Bacteroidia bacterium]MBP9690048.1 pseudouridylate synthase [Bacteroidia bacterium]